MTREELNILLASDRENENLEFKSAGGQMSITGKDVSRGDKLSRKSLYGYCVAIGNEGGGKLILGVKDFINPATGCRDIVGTNAIPNIQKAKEVIFPLLNVKIEIENIPTEKGKVQVVHIPSHPSGVAFKFYDIPLMRSGENLVKMDDATLKSIFNEGMEDFSSQVNRDATFADLDPSAISTLKSKWIEKTRNNDFKSLADRIVLEKLLLVTKRGITNACILLVGKSESIGRLIPCAEIFLEWRADEKKLEFDRRDIYREPYLLVHDKIWNFVQSRNSRVPFKHGFFEFDIWAYDENSIREAALNAFAHREYHNRTEPVFIRVSPDCVSVKSPGGFVPGVNADNAINAEGKWRNRLLMEVLSQVGLVERAGVGLDRIYRATIVQGKGLPDFLGTTDSSVTLNVPAKIKDLNFAYFAQKIESEIQINTAHDFIELEYIREHGKPLNKERVPMFLEQGIIEKVGKGRGTRYILAKKFYEFIDNRSEYTRKKWISKEQQKQVLINYFNQHKRGQMKDFRSLFENKLSHSQIFFLLSALRLEGKIFFNGKPRSPAGYWEIVKNRKN